MTTVEMPIPSEGNEQIVAPWTQRWFPGRRPSKETIVAACHSLPKKLLATEKATMLLNKGGKVVLPPLSQLNLVETLSGKMEGLSINNRRLNRSFTRGFAKANLGNMTRLVLTGNKLHSDCRGSRLLLSNLPTSLQQLTISWNGLGSELADVLGRRIIHMKNLKAISLAGNPLGSRGLRILIDLGNLHHIEELDLRQCDLGTSGAAMLARVLTKDDAKVKRVVLDMNLIAAFCKKVDKSLHVNVQVDRTDKIALLEITR